MSARRVLILNQNSKVLLGVDEFNPGAVQCGFGLSMLQKNERHAACWARLDAFNPDWARCLVFERFSTVFCVDDSGWRLAFRRSVFKGEASWAKLRE